MNEFMLKSMYEYVGGFKNCEKECVFFLYFLLFFIYFFGGFVLIYN